MDIKIWSENLLKEAFSIWNKNSFYSPHGVKVWYSVPEKNPELLIISYQPGGDITDFENEGWDNLKNGVFDIKENSYIDTDYKMSKRVRDFFDTRIDLIEKSTIFPLIFFRSPNISTWKKIEKYKREEMENFCFLKDKEIIKTLDPKRILIIGFETYRQIKINKIIDSIKDEAFVSIGNRNLLIKSKSPSINIFVAAHFTGCRFSKNDWSEMKVEFKEWLSGTDF